MQIYSAPTSAITVLPRRDRQTFDIKELEKLAESIVEVGQLQPGVCRKDPDNLDQYILIVGERRLRACALRELPFQFTLKEEELDPYQLAVIELAENHYRVNLTFVEEALALDKLRELGEARFGKAGKGGGYTLSRLLADTGSKKTSLGNLSEDLKLAAWIKANPDVAKQPNKTEAKKLIKTLTSQIENQHALAKAIAKAQANGLSPTPSQSGSNIESNSSTEQTFDMFLKYYNSHCIHADFDSWVKSQPDESFDVIIFDPPWGVEFDKVNQELNATKAYEDSKKKFIDMLPLRLAELFRVAKPNSHLYMFFGIVHYEFVYNSLRDAGFETNGFPIFWHKLGSRRQRHPLLWPGRCYEPIAFAVKGRKDLQIPGDPDIIQTEPPTPRIKSFHPSAKHPDIYRKLLQKSASPGDSILDPMAGSGMLAVAAESLRSELHLDWTQVEADKQFRDLQLVNLSLGYEVLVDKNSAEKPTTADVSDFRALTPGSKEWKRYWIENPEEQVDMLRFQSGQEK